MSCTVEACEVEGGPGLRVAIDVPFELRSLAEAELDVSAGALRLRGPQGEEVVAPVPAGSALDPQRATAKYSRKKRQLIVVSPDVGGPEGALRQVRSLDPAPSGATAPRGTPAPSGTLAPSAPVPRPPAPSAPALGASAPSSPVSDAPARSTDPCIRAAPVAVRGDSGGGGAAAAAPTTAHDDDDDDVPLLESSAARVVPKAASTKPVPDPGEEDATNEAADEMMRNAVAAREKKQREAEVARKDFKGGGLKKGFFGGSGKKEKPAAKKVAPTTAGFEEEVPYIAGAADPKQAAIDALRLPGVQEALQQQTEKLKTDKSWVTPQLMQALASRPDLVTGLSNPRVMEAFSLMQKNPQEAKRKYSGDPDVTKFLTEFSKLMATHFEVLGKDEKPAPAAMGPGAMGPGMPAPVPIEDPKVEEALRDPEVQQLVGELQRGRPLEMRELGATNPRLFQRVKVLLDAGLMNVQT